MAGHDHHRTTAHGWRRVRAAMRLSGRLRVAKRHAEEALGADRRTAPLALHRVLEERGAITDATVQIEVAGCTDDVTVPVRDEVPVHG